MKTYKIDMLAVDNQFLKLSVKLPDNSWHYIGVGYHRRIACHILLAVTSSFMLTFTNGERFERQFLGMHHGYPRIVTEEDVFEWLKMQQAAAI